MNSPKIPEYFSFSHRLRDFDAFAVAAANWEIDCWQLDKGSFEARISHIVTPSLILGELKFSRKIVHKSAPPKGFRTFAILADQNPNLCWRGKPISSNHLMVFPSNSQNESVTNPGFHVIGFSISIQRLRQAAERRGLCSIDELIPDMDLVQCASTTLKRIRNLALRLRKSAEVKPELLSQSSFRDDLEFDLIENLLDAVIDSELASATRPMAKTRSRALKKALDVIADRSHEAITLAEVEKLSGASGRTLRYAFEEAFALSPKQYLQAHRLNQVNRRLLRAGAETTVISDIANDWGFWHMGQFAADYRRMFGELPSTTVLR